jgi:hypothetical protein
LERLPTLTEKAVAFWLGETSYHRCGRGEGMRVEVAAAANGIALAPNELSTNERVRDAIIAAGHRIRDRRRLALAVWPPSALPMTRPTPTMTSPGQVRGAKTSDVVEGHEAHPAERDDGQVCKEVAVSECNE